MSQPATSPSQTRDEDASVEIPEITPATLRRMLAEDRAVQVIDIRPEEEFDEWRIPTSRSWPVYEAISRGEEPDPDDLPKGESGPVVTVCGSGKKSREATRILRERGREAYSLRGGLRGWTFAWNQAHVPTSGPATVVQIRRTGKGCLSYLIGTGEEAVVIDPSVDPSVYRTLAEKQDWSIRAVAETHVHADHCSRARRLSEETGAELFVPENASLEFSARSIGESDRIPIGAAELEVLATPGHTGESVTYRLGDEALFTGDTLFLRAVGRPDLDAEAEEARTKTRQLYRSLTRLRGLPSELLVLPGHVSRPVPFDGDPIGAPLGRVIERVDTLDLSEEAFLQRVLENVSETPPNHETVTAYNRRGDLPEGEELIQLEAGANRCAVG